MDQKEFRQMPDHASKHTKTEREETSHEEEQDHILHRDQDMRRKKDEKESQQNLKLNQI